ncbi:TRAP transporter small permease subunit [Marinomonas mediterranea]|uniref:TRAP transporter small permease protein n=1 Tax=Marinomonas mediterranea (strain ATCC 700492 / JCM 21426 / NBRC 103028 / MMB-1) TaxID=717774 RepID=F2JXM4_MARM1|nr:TRAP transporter small permease [Marinomonas mediterranea]ADZ93022.1 tripartite ATP-independent periplasmic transporter DctQ [Marinomonas mediterranea MMB-1]WCN10932.1 TRAP transporter small permease subunit [Marinomonas mediterranea]WCN14994.1 TRAP transporter small permease subunit [Marinomonas mediterranea]WCN19038.1 TRAP transporter small permease subunit [Marinomonas mediterranea MMB-1]
MNNNENPNTSVEEVSAVALDHLNDIQFNNALDRWVDRLGGYVSFLFLISVGISFYEIISRYFFNAPTIWVHESTTMICALCMAYGGSYCLARNTHISIKMLYDAVGDRGRHCLDIVNALLSVFFCSLIAYAGYIMTHKALFTPSGMFRLETSGSAWNPVTPAVVKTGLFVILLLMTLQSIIRLIQAIKKAR